MDQFNKTESYMINGSMTATQFYVDIEGHPETSAMKHALKELEFYCGEKLKSWELIWHHH